MAIPPASSCTPRAYSVAKPGAACLVDVALGRG
jgi:hypothetical protein